MVLLLLTLLFYFVICFITGLLGLFLAFLLYLHYIHKVNEHLPGPPRSSFIFGHLPDIQEYRKKGGTFFDYRLELLSKYGPITVLFYGYIPLITISDPVYISEILNDFKTCGYKSKFIYGKLGYVFGERIVGTALIANLDDESWRRRRHIMNPAFHRKCLRSFMDDFNEVCDRFMMRMANIVEQDTSMLTEFASLTLDVISQVLFNVKLGAIEDPNCPFAAAIASVLRGIQANINSALPASLLSIYQFKLFQSASMKDQIDAVKFLRKFALDCITKRINDIKANKKVPDDLLTLLVNEKSLSIDDIIDEFVMTFVAGQETTSTSLSFTIYELTQNAHIEGKIVAEINNIIGSKEKVEFADLSNMKYLGQVLQESLRKYPVGPGPERYLGKEVTVGGYKIPKVSLVSLEKYLISRNPEVWPNPEIFDPDRFSEPEKIPNFNATYFPFSVAPRNCIGLNVAQFESKVVLARLLQKFRFKLIPGQTAAIEQRLTLAPRDGVICKVMLR